MSVSSGSGSSGSLHLLPSQWQNPLLHPGADLSESPRIRPGSVLEATAQAPRQSKRVELTLSGESTLRGELTLGGAQPLVGHTEMNKFSHITNSFCSNSAGTTEKQRCISSGVRRP